MINKESRGNNFNNGDEALFEDSQRPRDSYGFKIQPGMQSNKLDFGSQVKNFYLDQISAVGGKEITGIDGSLSDVVIPLGLGMDKLNDLPYSTYGANMDTAAGKNKGGYTKGKLSRRITNDGGIIIPTGGSYMVEFYSEVYFDPNIGLTSYAISLLNEDKQPFSRDARLSAINPDYAGRTTIKDFQQGDILYLGGIHASTSGKKALYLGGITIFKLS